MIDLRSDTVSLPTAEMRRAIYEAELGDDCFGDDPTVRRLEEYCADYFGKEAAMFTCGGTMSNQLAIKALTQPGDEVVLHSAYHINYFEAASTSAFSGVNFNLIHTDDGIFDSSHLRMQYSTKARWNNKYALPKVIVVENTVGSKGGTIIPLDVMKDIQAYARKIDARVYLDGARLLHAVAATGVSARDYAATVDCLAICFSKSLGAPVGSILVGSREFVNEARRYRKWIGGDMHQSGIIAAGALYAITHNVGRLGQDHANARLIFEAAQTIEGAVCTYRGTNMFYIDVHGLGAHASDVVHELERAGVRTLAWNEQVVRVTTHINIGHNEAVAAAQIIQKVLSGFASRAGGRGGES